MKYTFFLLLLLLVSCSQERGLHPELERIIEEYQTAVPIPNSHEFERYVFVYEIDFNINGGDTIVQIVRRPSGIPKNSNCFGVYIVGKGFPVVVYDENNAAGIFVKKKIRNGMIGDYERSKKKKAYADYPPVYSYSVSQEKLRFLRIDTISDEWAQ